MNGAAYNADALHVEGSSINYSVSAVGYETASGSLTKTAVDEVVTVNLQEAQVVPTFSVVPADATIIVNDFVWVAGSNYSINQEFEYTISCTGYETITNTIILTEENKDIIVNLVAIMVVPTFTVVDSDNLSVLDYNLTVNGEELKASYEYGTDLVYEVTASGYETASGSEKLTDSNKDFTITLVEEVI